MNTFLVYGSTVIVLINVELLLGWATRNHYSQSWRVFGYYMNLLMCFVGLCAMLFTSNQTVLRLLVLTAIAGGIGVLYANDVDRQRLINALYFSWRNNGREANDGYEPVEITKRERDKAAGRYLEFKRNVVTVDHSPV